MPAKFEVKKGKDGQFHFVLKASNGEVILSSEMYKAKTSAMNGIESVKKNAPMDERFELKSSSKGNPFFVLKAANRQVIGQSEMYESEKSRKAGIASVKKSAPGAAVTDLTA